MLNSILLDGDCSEEIDGVQSYECRVTGPEVASRTDHARAPFSLGSSTDRSPESELWFMVSKWIGL